MVAPRKDVEFTGSLAAARQEGCAGGRGETREKGAARQLSA
jgi:hypothetical protein